MWNGTADTLNAKPTSSRPSATSASGDWFIASAATTEPRRSSFVLPETPNAKAIPYRKKALEKAPSRKYLKPASAPIAWRRMAVST